MISEQYKEIFADEKKVADLAKKILTDGYVALDNFLTETARGEWLEAIADRKIVNKKSGDLSGTPMYDLAMSDEMLRISQALYDERCNITGEKKATLRPEKQVVGVPYKDGRSGSVNKETAYHIDGAYSNWLLPLVLPEDSGAGSGNLVMFPNLRLRYPKVIAQILARLLKHSAWFRRRYGYTEVIYKPHTMYIFFGDLSFHGVDPIKSGERVVVTINSHW